MKTITKESLFELINYAQPVISPNKQKIIYVQTKTSQEADTYESSLVCYDVQSKKHIQWTFEGKFNGSPKFNQDGDKLAFISNRKETNQLFVLPLDGGEALQITTMKHGVSTYQWLPNNQGFIVQAPTGEGEAFKENEAKGYDALHYRHDLKGYSIPGVYEQLYVVKEGEVVIQLTSGDQDHHLSDVHESGKKLLLIKKRHTSELNQQEALYELNLETKEMIDLSEFASDGEVYQGFYQPNGELIAVIASKQPMVRVSQPELFMMNPNTKEVTKVYHEDRHIGDCSVADLKMRSNGKTAMFNETGDAFYFRVAHYGRVSLHAINMQTEAVHPIVELEGCVADFDVVGDVVVYGFHSPLQPSNLYLKHALETIQMTHGNDAFVAEHTFGRYEEIELATHDQKRLHGFIVYPASFDGQKKYPIIYNIHGGPAAMHGLSFFHEVQVMANEGYAVLLVNPRGSYGYGEAHMRGILGDYGGHDYLDLMDGMDYVLTNYEWLDKDRQYVTGGSYGGYMTNWIVTHTNRFKAAVTQRSISNWLSFWGTSDIGYFFVEWEFQGANVINQFDVMWERSPLAHIKNAKTPTLVIHAEADFRCPIEQGEQMFTGLKYQGVDTRLVRFPKSTHELSRSGIPSLRMKRLEEMMGWFKKYE